MEQGEVARLRGRLAAAHAERARQDNTWETRLRELGTRPLTFMERMKPLEERHHAIIRQVRAAGYHWPDPTPHPTQGQPCVPSS